MTATASEPLAYVMGDMDLVRPLGLAGIRCVAVARPGTPPRYSRFTGAVVERTEPWREQEAQVAALTRHASAADVPPGLYYGGDAELLLVSRHRESLAERFRFVIPDREVVDDCVDKVRFHAMATRLGLPVPWTEHLRPARGDVPDSLPLPVVIKPLTRHQELWEAVGASAKAVRVDSAEALDATWERMAAQGIEVVAQELVPGPEAAIESYHAYVDAAGAIAGEFTGRKIRTLPPQFGHSTALTVTEAADVAELGRDVLARIGLRGLAKVDFKRQADGALRLLEVNPRFSLWHHLGAVAGVNLPALVHADLSGRERPPVRRARPGTTWANPSRDLRAARAGGVALWDWLRFVRRCDALSELAVDDPMPFVRGRLERRLRKTARSAPAALRRSLA